MTPLLTLEDLVVDFAVARRGLMTQRVMLRALDGVSLAVPPGAAVGVVGESGCGKTTLLRAAAGLVRPTSGRVCLAGVDLAVARGGPRREALRRLGLVFQDPGASLDPTLPLARTVAEPLRVAGTGTRRTRDERARALLARVGLDPALGDAWPHALSTGQRQRAAIARALATDPALLLADEPVAALDASARAAVLALLDELRRTLPLALLFVSHDLGAVRLTCERVVVLYLGRVVEEGPTEALFEGPLHPYTEALLDAVPVPDPVVQRARPARRPLGDPPSPVDRPPGCPYHPRCPLAEAGCRTAAPPLEGRAGARRVACWKR